MRKIVYYQNVIILQKLNKKHMYFYFFLAYNNKRKVIEGSRSKYIVVPERSIAISTKNESGGINALK